MMFPPLALDIIMEEMNLQLEQKNRAPITRMELLKFFGILILATRFEFTSRHSLWATTPVSRYEQAPQFGKLRMSRDRFDAIWNRIRFGRQPNQRPDNMTSAEYRWLLVDAFVESFNLHRARNFIPGETICVDESMSRWYGQGGDWINHGLPTYVAIDQKPENGCEIQNAACGTTGIMLQLALVKGGASVYENVLAGDGANDGEILNHGTLVLKKLLVPWFQSGRLICADSYFSSVGAVEELGQVGLRFIGVVKTATKKFPMEYLKNIVLNNKGDRHGVVLRDQGPGQQIKMMAFVWVDRERRYFVCSASNLSEGQPYSRGRW